MNERTSKNPGIADDVVARRKHKDCFLDEIEVSKSCALSTVPFVPLTFLLQARKSQDVGDDYLQGAAELPGNACLLARAGVRVAWERPESGSVLSRAVVSASSLGL